MRRGGCPPAVALPQRWDPPPPWARPARRPGALRPSRAGRVPGMATLETTDERRAFVDSIRDFCRRECGTREQRAGGGQHPPDLYRKMAELGWLGVAISDEYGGTGGGAVDMCLLLDELGYGLVPVNGIGTTFIVAGASQRFGTPAPKEAMLGGTP